jgi:hypothetical protein
MTLKKERKPALYYSALRYRNAEGTSVSLSWYETDRKHRRWSYSLDGAATFGHFRSKFEALLHAARHCKSSLKNINWEPVKDTGLRLTERNST